MKRKNAILTPIKEFHDPVTVNPVADNFLVTAWEEHRRRTKLVSSAYTLLTPVQQKDELENRIIEEQAQKTIKNAVLRWRDRNRGHKQREQQCEEGFNLAEKIFISNQLPNGTYLGYMPIVDKTDEQANKAEDILFEDGSFLSSEPPISTESAETMLGIIKPNGVTLYYHSLNSSPRLHPADNFVKLNLNSTLPFEVYRYDNAQKSFYYEYPEKIVRLQNRQGENFIRKQTVLDLDVLQNIDEELREVKLRLQQPDLKKSARKKLLGAHTELTEIQRALEQSYKEQLNAISNTAKMESDIFEPYCANTIMYTREQANSKKLTVYVERILPDKGENLAKLLSNENLNPLTSAERIEIAKQCVALVCSLYDKDHPLSKKGIAYSHGQIDLSHFCVSFRKDDFGNRTPKVSLVGFKVYAKDEPKPNPIANAYMAPEVIMGKNESNAYRSDIYSLGVVLAGLENNYKVPKRKIRERIGYLHPLTFRGNIEKGVLFDIDVSTLDESQKRDYAQLKMLARQLTSARPAQRPDLDELRIAAGFCPALKALKEAMVNEVDPQKAAQLDQMARKAVDIMKALAEYKVHHEQQKEKTSILDWLGFGTHHKSKKAMKSSKAILNATDVSVFNEELERLMAEAQHNYSNHRSSFTSILYKALAKDGGLSSKEMRECKSLVVELAIKTKPSPESKKYRRPSDEELTAEESVESESQKTMRLKARGFLGGERGAKIGITG